MSETMTAEPQAVSVQRPKNGIVPLLYDSPHSGRVYPADFNHAVEERLLVGGEDRFVDDLVLDAPGSGVTLIKALFARTYIDPNRMPTDLDPDLLPADWEEETTPTINSRRGVGLIFRMIGDSVPIYSRALSAKEIRHRIERYWRPYHQAVDTELDRLQQQFGTVFHINWHSMQAIGNALAPDPGRRRPDFVLGDLNGRACDPAFTDYVAGTLEKFGYSVSLNDPYKGAYIVERYGVPQKGRHTLQIEINRALYMDHGTLDRTCGFDDLKRKLSLFTEKLATFVQSNPALKSHLPSTSAQ